MTDTAAPLAPGQPPAPGWWLASDGNWYPPQPVAPSAVTWSKAVKLLLGAASADIIGAFLPWVSVTIFGVTLSKAGTSGDGVITLILGVVIGLLAFRSRSRLSNTATLWALVLSVLVEGVAVYDIVNVSNNSYATVGSGLLLTAAGGICGIVASIMRCRELRASVAT
jgi:hypothetical protein